jgi:hypothetical protein
MLPYNVSFQPPAPTLYIEAISPSTSVRRSILAKLDSIPAQMKRSSLKTLQRI